MLLKAFFGPMMVMSLLRFCQGAMSTGERLLDDGGLAAGLFALLVEHAFWFFMNIILFVDVLLFTVGYLVESPRLRNEIRSVDATLIGWGAALLCYPPFNALTGSILGSNVSDFPKFDDPTVHVVLNALLLVLMAIYASASVALGSRAQPDAPRHHRSRALPLHPSSRVRLQEHGMVDRLSAAGGTGLW